MSLEIKKIPGEMPPVWERQVVFFANILSLFYGNELETDVLRQEVGALETYGGRLVPLLNLMFKGENNLLVLEHQSDAVLMAYYEKNLGLTLPDIKVVSHQCYLTIPQKNDTDRELKSVVEALQRHPAEWIDGYVTDQVLGDIAGLINKKTISLPEGSRLGNNKYLLYQLLSSKGLPVFDTCMAETVKDVDACLQHLRQKGYKTAVVKAPIGASGIGMKKVDLDAKSTPAVPEFLFYEGACLVQGWLDESFSGITYIGSPSVQMFLTDECLSLFDITEQILSRESVHEGNIAPPPTMLDDGKTKDVLLTQAEVAGRWLHDQGYRGSASVDFHLVERGGEREVRICEINARVTGATYPAILARFFLPNGSWLMRNIRFLPPIDSTTLLSILKEQHLLYEKGKKEGVLPINFNPDDEDLIVKGQFLFIGATYEKTYRLLKKMSEVSTLKGDYDRD